MFNSHLWHGGTRNRTAPPRRALHSYFTRRGNGQQLDQREYIRPETLSGSARPPGTSSTCKVWPFVHVLATSEQAHFGPRPPR